jgi:hypothetical protein
MRDDARCVKFYAGLGFSWMRATLTRALHRSVDLFGCCADSPRTNETNERNERARTTSVWVLFES